MINMSYSLLEKQLKEIADLQYASAVLNWDQETYMPIKSNASRSRQIATLATLAHQKACSSELKNSIDGALQEDLNEEQKANVLIALKDYNKAVLLPEDFVNRLSMQTSKTYHSWVAARKQNEVSIFLPDLSEMIALKKEQASFFEAVHPYDALLDEYEPGATVAQLDPLFSSLKQQLSPLLQAIQNANTVDNQVLHQFYDKQQQWDFSIDVLQHIGYDFEAGRQDYAEHPFTTSFSAQDVRITTRVDEHDFSNLLWSSIHEAGHALYEQGIRDDMYGMPIGSACSLSIHESQSRIWENNIGRGKLFWMYWYPKLQQQVSGFNTTSLEQFYAAINKVAPSLIRTEADELTYHFHVMIRYEIEKGLIDGSIQVKDIKQVWNDYYQNYLGIHAQDDRDGVLQDIHWSHGSFGYFPTYSLGSLYAAQFYAFAKQAIPDLERNLELGHTKEFLKWLRTSIHAFGRRYTSDELCKLVTGSSLDTKYFFDYANKKYKEIYKF
jgi:carboxypeptidase Taq